MSKAKLLSDPAGDTHGVQAFVYRGVEAACTGENEGSPPLPSGAEPLWSESPGQQLSQEPAKTHTDEEIQVREQQAWEKGFQEATLRARENMEKALQADRERIAAALDEFAKEREDYFRNVEGEAVRLVLSIARKVLHREAQVDPLLLTGVVRVTLENIASGTHLKLRVPAIQAGDWRAALGSMSDFDSEIEIVGDKSLRGPECLIVTDAGTTDLSLEGQLAEIERGFLDLLPQRAEEREMPSPSYAA